MAVTDNASPASALNAQIDAQETHWPGSFLVLAQGIHASDQAIQEDRFTRARPNSARGFDGDGYTTRSSVTVHNDIAADRRATAGSTLVLRIVGSPCGKESAMEDSISTMARHDRTHGHRDRHIRVDHVEGPLSAKSASDQVLAAKRPERGPFRADSDQLGKQSFQTTSSPAPLCAVVHHGPFQCPGSRPCRATPSPITRNDSRPRAAASRYPAPIVTPQ
jgi:hypothetical protein